MNDFLKSSAQSEEQWISVSDMMAGLMMIFLFIYIIYIQNISKYFSEVAEGSDQIVHGKYLALEGNRALLEYE